MYMGWVKIQTAMAYSAVLPAAHTADMDQTRRLDFTICPIVLRPEYQETNKPRFTVQTWRSKRFHPFAPSSGADIEDDDAAIGLCAINRACGADAERAGKICADRCWRSAGMDGHELAR